MQNELNQILQAKDNRQLVKKEYGDKGYAVVSVNFNVPGYPKTDEQISKAFSFMLTEFTAYLKAIRLPFVCMQNTCDAAGNICYYPFFTTNIDLLDLKNKLEYFEHTHTLGRLLDVDLFDEKQTPISSEKQKHCFICKDKSAIYCMRHNTHTYAELRIYVENKIKKYNNKKEKNTICRTLTEIAIRSILTEVSLLSKPGLVSPNCNGSHTDMNYHTFLASISAISKYFEQVAKLGYKWNGKNRQNAIVKLRMIGLQMEHDMFISTQGVNTQKGIVFLIVFCLFVSAYTLKRCKTFNIDFFSEVMRKLNKELVSKELLLILGGEKQTHGERCFKDFGKKLAGGIRMEVEEGLPTFFNHILPFMNKLNFSLQEYNDKQEFENKCMLILLKIMSVNNDTNILFRSNDTVLEQLKNKATKILHLNNDNLCNNADFDSLKKFCADKNISPGGSADLLAVSLFLHQIIELKFGD